jgi:molybdate transport system substrate-binding protein
MIMVLKVKSLTVALVGILISAQSGLADDLKILAIGAVAPLFRQLIPEFERNSGHRVVATVGPSAELVERMRKGEQIDAVFAGTNLWDPFVEQGKMEAGTEIARTGVGMAVRKGEPKPDISNSDALRQSLLRAKSLGGLSVGIGVETMQVIRELKISDQIQSKYHLYPNGTALRAAIMRGEIEIGFSVIADLAGYGDQVDFVGPVPPDVQKYVVIRAALANSAKKELARSFINFVVRPDRSEIFKSYWLEPRF